MIELLLPDGVACFDAYTDSGSLLPAEEVLVAKAVRKRRDEFTTTRSLARKAMGKLGIDPSPILKGDNGEPLWPRGVVGSLAHTDGYRAAVVAHSLAVRSLGIDAEPHEQLPQGVLDHVSLPAEREALAARGDALHWDRILFCAKEATYKAWFPLTRRWLGFEDAHIVMESTGPAEGIFRSQILIDGSVLDGGEPLLYLDGTWRVDGGLIATAIAL